ncbi:Outer membrane protein assembly factor BamA [termite gut metagenome]|uniref:Outer membrane protein assembly factor BamA n=1 Tax=termite gut metagenome TaxID=433724 RepID=A0A5J4ST88_9ZZZZ
MLNNFRLNRFYIGDTSFVNLMKRSIFNIFFTISPRNAVFYLLFLIAVFLITSCSTTKFVPEGSYLLDKMEIQTDNKRIKPSALKNYIRQKPNSKWLGMTKFRLHIYNISGRDSIRWYNKIFRRIGAAPVIYNEVEAANSAEEITKAMQNIGYLNTSIKSITETKKKKIKLLYQITSGNPYSIRTLTYDIADAAIAGYITGDSLATLLKKGMVFDVNLLDAERRRITNLLVNNGYYKFHKDYITYKADIDNDYSIDLTLQLRSYVNEEDTISGPYRQYLINKVSFIADYDMSQSSEGRFTGINDSIRYDSYPIYFKNKLYLHPKTLIDNTEIQPGHLYREQDIQRTYTYLGRLPALKYTNIHFVEAADTSKLDCYVMLTKSKHQSVSVELEGTNSAGDFGAATSLSFQHRNLFHGSESFLLKFRSAYEAISGLQQGYNNDNYIEYGVETNVNFPNFLFPLLPSSIKQKIKATTEFGLQYNYQLRPEFSRTVASASWSYKWTRPRTQYRIDLLDVNYLYMPWKSDKFVEDYLTDGGNYMIEYNYKNRLIVRTGYMYNYNSMGGSLVNNTIVDNSYSIRINVESAGNTLLLFSRMVKLHKNKDGEYSILNIPFAQYVKADFDYVRDIVIAPGKSLAFHFATGVAVPYGNASVIPFEKQYFSGGANSVRGWLVRGLGPGSYSGNGKYLNQFGEIKLDANIEYRNKLFWKFKGAIFIDAGNIWTIHEYENQPGGVFKFDKFYKQIAVAYGLGLRFDFDFFVLRLDGGMKAINPVYMLGKDRYPIIHPNFGRDFALHFAVGYPF